MTTKITPMQLQAIGIECTKAHERAKAAWGARDMVAEAWAELRHQLNQAADDDAKALITTKFQGVFLAFASLDQDMNMLLGAPINGSAEQRAKKRDALDRNPALRAWMAEKDERAAQLQARIDLNAANMAERVRAGLPALHLSRLRAAGHNLMLDGKGRLLTTPGAPLDQGYGVGIYAERKSEFVALLKKEAEEEAAEAKRMAPVVLA